MAKIKKWKRKCSDCGEEQFYTRIYERDRAEKQNTKCNSCAKKGKKRKSFSDEWKKKIGKSVSGEKNGMYGVHRFGENNPNFGLKYSDKTRKNMRLSAIKRIERNGGQIMPNHNPKAIFIIEEEAKKYNIIDLQHAENGGEYQVCGYFVDGYSPSKNIVIEYYEPFHKKQVERDEQRKQEIIKELDCKFIEIKE